MTISVPDKDVGFTYSTLANMLTALNDVAQTVKEMSDTVRQIVDKQKLIDSKMTTISSGYDEIAALQKQVEEDIARLTTK